MTLEEKVIARRARIKPIRVDRTNSLPALCLPAQPVVNQNQGHHGLAHDDEAGQQTGIVPALDRDFSGLAAFGYRLLRAGQAAGRLDRNAADDRLAAGNAAKHAAVAIAFGADDSTLVRRQWDKGVVVGAAAGRGDSETYSIFEGRHRRQGQKRLGQVGFQLVEHWFAEPGGDSIRHQLAHSANGILILSHLLDESDHFLRPDRIGTAHRSRLDLLERGPGRFENVGLNIADLLDVTEDMDAMRRQNFLGDGAGSDPADGLAGAGSATSPIITEAVLGIEAEIGMPWPIFVLDLRIILAALVLIVEEDADGGAVSLALEDTGPDFRHILFLALADDLGLARPAAAQVQQQVIYAQRQAGGTTVYDRQIPRPVADPGRGHAKQFAKRIAWHGPYYTPDAIKEGTGNRTTVILERIRMRSGFILTALVLMITPLAAQPPDRLASRYGYDVIENKYPQKSPEDALASAIKAIETKKFDYLMAQLADPIYVDKKIEEYKRQFAGKEESRTLLAFDRLTKETAKYFQDDPLLVKELKRFAKEGMWKTEAAKAVCTLKVLPGRQVFMRKIQSRWFLENKQS